MEQLEELRLADCVEIEVLWYFIDWDLGDDQTVSIRTGLETAYDLRAGRNVVICNQFIVHNADVLSWLELLDECVIENVASDACGHLIIILNRLSYFHIN